MLDKPEDIESGYQDDFMPDFFNTIRIIADT